MNRPHCDLCDALVTPYRRWCEVELETGKITTIHVNPISSQHAGAAPDYCAKCWKRVLTTLLDDLARDQS